MRNKSQEADDKEKALLTFLSRTREGEYATIDEGSLPYGRITEDSETIMISEEFYYGFS